VVQWGYGLMDWLVYENEGATRNLPLSDRWIDAASRFIPELGLRVHVVSGGQHDAETARRLGTGRVGSVRHDNGDAGDVDFYHPELGLLDARIPEHREILAQVVSRGREAGFTGYGMGMDEGDYMGPHRMHMGFGATGVWGDDGVGANAPEWLRAAFYGVEPGPGSSPSPGRARAAGLGTRPLPQGPGLPSAGQGLPRRPPPEFVRRGNERLAGMGLDTSRQGQNNGAGLIELGMHLLNEGY
jgi:hypothetical protein